MGNTQNATCMNYESDCGNSQAVRMNALSVVTTVIGALSTLGCLTIVITYMAYPNLRTMTRKLLVYLSFADYFVAVGNVIGAVFQCRVLAPTSHAGEIQSFVNTFATMCSYFWTTFFAVYLYVVIVKGNVNLADKLVWMFHVVGWLLPAAVTTAAAVKGKLGCTKGANGNTSEAGLADDTGGWCWIKLDESHGQNVAWMLITAKFWEVSCYVVLIIFYVLIKRHVNQEKSAYSHNRRLVTRDSLAAVTKTVDKKLIFVPVIFIGIRIWGTIRFFLYVASPLLIECGNNKTVWLMYMQGIGDSAQGAFNCVLFCFAAKSVRKQWANTFSCRKKRKSYVDEDDGSEWYPESSQSSGVERNTSPTPPEFNVDSSENFSYSKGQSRRDSIQS
eukprot:m.1010 g.1010  ORF g.1010 m.1010 type:complete len:388 (+) comp5454_c0_seq1:129-1292(+)